MSTDAQGKPTEQQAEPTAAESTDTPEQVETTEPQEPQEVDEAVFDNLPDAVKEELETLRGEMELARAEVAASRDKVLRAQAEVENIRRRSENDVSKAHKFALEKFSNELLPVLDNLERAIEVADPENEVLRPMMEGVELTLKSFQAVIEKFGIKIIDPKGQPFNPDQHMAMSMQESTEVAPNTVIAVMQKGFELNGRLLRPAMVMVSRAPAAGVDTKA